MKRQHRVGCGHKALGLALGVQPEKVREVADKFVGRHRGVGLYDHEVEMLARRMGGAVIEENVTRELRTINSFGRKRQRWLGPTAASYVRMLQERCRAAGAENRYILRVSRHFIGVCVGATGAVSWVGAQTGWMKRARVINAWLIVTK